MSTKPKFEQTEVGVQTLISGVRPVTLGEKLTARTYHPMTPKRNPNASKGRVTLACLMKWDALKSTCLILLKPTHQPQRQNRRLRHD